MHSLRQHVLTGCFPNICLPDASSHGPLHGQPALDLAFFRQSPTSFEHCDCFHRYSCNTADFRHISCDCDSCHSSAYGGYPCFKVHKWLLRRCDAERRHSLLILFRALHVGCVPQFDAGFVHADYHHDVLDRMRAILDYRHHMVVYRPIVCILSAVPDCAGETVEQGHSVHCHHCDSLQRKCHCEHIDTD